MNFTKIIGLLMITMLALSSCQNKSNIESSTSTNPHKTEKLNWLSMNDIEAAMKRDPRPILVDVYTKWCGPCKMLDRNTFSDPEIQQIFKDKFHIVKYDAEGKGDIVFNGKTYSNPKYQEGKRGRNSSHQLTSMFKVRGYPTMAIMDANFKIIDKIVGYKSPEQLIPALQKYIK